MRHYCFRAYFFSAGAGTRQSTISEGCDGTVKTVMTCREWIIYPAYTSILGWDEAHLEIATSAPWVWMNACQMIHQTQGKRFISKSNVTDLDLLHWHSNLSFGFSVFFLFLKIPSAVNVDSTDGGEDKRGSQPWEKSASLGKLNLHAQKKPSPLHGGKVLPGELKAETVLEPGLWSWGFLKVDPFSYDKAKDLAYIPKTKPWFRTRSTWARWASMRAKFSQEQRSSVKFLVKELA